MAIIISCRRLLFVHLCIKNKYESSVPVTSLVDPSFDRIFTNRKFLDSTIYTQGGPVHEHNHTRKIDLKIF